MQSYLCTHRSPLLLQTFVGPVSARSLYFNLMCLDNSIMYNPKNFDRPPSAGSFFFIISFSVTACVCVCKGAFLFLLLHSCLLNVKQSSENYWSFLFFLFGLNLTRFLLFDVIKLLRVDLCAGVNFFPHCGELSEHFRCQTLFQASRHLARRSRKKNKTNGPPRAAARSNRPAYLHGTVPQAFLPAPKLPTCKPLRLPPYSRKPRLRWASNLCRFPLMTCQPNLQLAVYIRRVREPSPPPKHHRRRLCTACGSGPRALEMAAWDVFPQ